jgi:hypothetical protein
MIFILDQDTKKIVWKCIHRDIKNSLEGQHSPQLLPSGRMLIFDNGRYRGYSRVIEIDPVSLDILWEYRAQGFYTLSQGYAQRLSDGNTLVTESERGRVFEITGQKKLSGNTIILKFKMKAIPNIRRVLAAGNGSTG